MEAVEEYDTTTGHMCASDDCVDSTCLSTTMERNTIEERRFRPLHNRSVGIADEIGNLCHSFSCRYCFG